MPSLILPKQAKISFVDGNLEAFPKFGGKEIFMNRDTLSDPRKARRVNAPLPHPSWRHGEPLPREKPKALSAEEFWERLGI